MEGDEAGGQSAAARTRDLQPSGQPELRDLGAPVSTDGLSQLNGDDCREAEQWQERIDADEQLFGMLARDGFAGTLYERFVDELVRYGISVLRGWMYSGFIFTLLADRGFGLHPREWELEKLVSDGDLREELAIMTVATALPRFRQRAFIEGGWNPTGGASITTYFVGACAYDFPNEFRRWQTSEERHRLALQRVQERYEAPVSQISAADEVLGKMEVQECLSRIKDARTRAAVALAIDDYSQEEIRQVLSAASVRVIEGLIHRWRTKEKRDWDRGRR